MSQHSGDLCHFQPVFTANTRLDNAPRLLLMWRHFCIEQLLYECWSLLAATSSLEQVENHSGDTFSGHSTAYRTGRRVSGIVKVTQSAAKAVTGVSVSLSSAAAQRQIKMRITDHLVCHTDAGHSFVLSSGRIWTYQMRCWLCFRLVPS